MFKPHGILVQKNYDLYAEKYGKLLEISQWI